MNLSVTQTLDHLSDRIENSIAGKVNSGSLEITTEKMVHSAIQCFRASSKYRDQLMKEIDELVFGKKITDQKLLDQEFEELNPNAGQDLTLLSSFVEQCELSATQGLSFPAGFISSVHSFLENHKKDNVFFIEKIEPSNIVFDRINEKCDIIFKGTFFHYWGMGAPNLIIDDKILKPIETDRTRKVWERKSCTSELHYQLSKQDFPPGEKPRCLKGRLRYEKCKDPGLVAQTSIRVLLILFPEQKCKL